MAGYNPKRWGAEKFAAGAILPPEKVKPCEKCGTPTYTTSGKRSNYRALAIKTSKGYVAVPFDAHKLAVGGCSYADVPGLAEKVEDRHREALGLEPRTGLVDLHPSVRGRLEVMVKNNPEKYSYPSTPEQKTPVQEPAAPAESPSPTTASAPTEKPKGFTNKYAGNCVDCGTRVGTGEGVTSRGAGGWEVRCVGCHHG
jgi:hypothetical protein